MNITHRRDLWNAIIHIGCSAEIGVAEGHFSAEILNWPIAITRHYLVDRWKTVPIKGDSAQSQEWHDRNLKSAMERVEKFGQRAKILRGDSVEMAKHVRDESLSFLYIDADHSYEGVMSDLKAWEPKLMPYSVVALHDYEMPQYGVKRAVQEFCKNKFEIRILPEDKQENAGAYFYYAHSL